MKLSYSCRSKQYVRYQRLQYDGFKTLKLQHVLFNLFPQLKWKQPQHCLLWALTSRRGEKDLPQEISFASVLKSKKAELCEKGVCM